MLRQTPLAFSAPKLSDQDSDVISAEFLQGISDEGQRTSVHQCVQNHFFPDAGNFRGVADGSGNSALSSYQTSAVINSSATNQWIMFSFAPTIDQTSSNTLQLSQNPTFANPYKTTPAQGGYLGIGGAFNGTNPSTDYRVVSATIRIIPTGAYTGQSAEGKVAYLSDLGALGSSTSSDGNWSAANIDNRPWSMPVTGLTDMMLHWVPNDYETKFRGTGYAKNSAIVGYLNAANGNSSWRIDIKYVIEYLPTVAYTPFVPALPPDMHPNTYYHMNHVVRALYYPLILGEYNEWLKMYEKFKGVSGGYLAHTSGGFALNTAGLAHTNFVDVAEARPPMRSFRGLSKKGPGFGTYFKEGINKLGYLIPTVAVARRLANAQNYALNGNIAGQPALPMIRDLDDEL